MRVVMMAKLKGGCGSTTLARELAVAATLDGLEVGLLDLDAQGTLSRWWNRRTRGESEGTTPNPRMLSVRGADEVPGIIAAARRHLDLVVIDVPPSTNAVITDLMKHADICLVPTRPTTDDLEALPPVIRILAAQQASFAFVLTQIPGSRSRLGQDSIAYLARQGRVAAMVQTRGAFPVAAVEGKTAVETGRDAKARAEIKALWGWVKDNVPDVGHATAPSPRKRVGESCQHVGITGARETTNTRTRESVTSHLDAVVIA